jgi:hypothetical protein
MAKDAMTNPIDLRLGRWQDVLADVETCDAVICDPPYSARTHEGHNGMEEQIRALTRQLTREPISYEQFSPAAVSEFVSFWAPRCRGWIGAMTSHDLIPAWEAAYKLAKLHPFAPVPIIQKRPRLVGDGPSSWAVYFMVARPRNREFATWGCLAPTTHRQ